ncbi:MAG: hypothetical protein IJZ88_06640 [Clostridia bacterium]|nr:hypothetical protein [Clostridia bacterium]
MASLCPKCKRKLKLTDLKPTCPSCGTNLLYYRIEERLEVDALNAEIEHAHTQKMMDRAKAAMIGSPWAIVRDVLLVLVIASFLLPLANLTAVGPYFERDTTYTAINLVTTLMEFDFGVVGLIGSPIVGNATLYFAGSIVCVALALVVALFQLIFSFLSCSKRGFGRNVTFAVLGMVFSIGSSVLFNMFVDAMNEVLPGFMSGSVKFGIYVVAGMFALVLILNVLIKVKGLVKVEYTPCYIGKENMLYEEFVEKYGKDRVTFDMVMAHHDEFMVEKEDQPEEVNA